MSALTTRIPPRVPQGRILGGVCTGLARSMSMDLTLVRVIMAAIVLFTGIGPLVYVGLWLAMPEESAQQSGLDRLVREAQQWNASRQVYNPRNTSTAARGTQPETFDLYDDRRA